MHNWQIITNTSTVIFERNTISTLAQKYIYLNKHIVAGHNEKLNIPNSSKTFIINLNRNKRAFNDGYAEINDFNAFTYCRYTSLVISIKSFYPNKLPSMKKILMLSLIVSGLWISGCATSNTTSSRDDSERYEEPVANSKLNNKRLEKNLGRFSEELNLSKRQQKQLKKIDKRYARLDRKLSRNENSKRRDHRELASQKREEILEVLTTEQQQKLETLVKKGRFSFDQWFGK